MLSKKLFHVKGILCPLIYRLDEHWPLRLTPLKECAQLCLCRLPLSCFCVPSRNSTAAGEKGLPCLCLRGIHVGRSDVCAGRIRKSNFAVLINQEWLMSGNWCVWLAEPHEARATLHLKSLSSGRMRGGLGRPSEGVGPSPTTYPT